MTRRPSRTRRHRREVWPVLWLTAVWVLLWGNVSFANVLAGLVLGGVMVRVMPLPRLRSRITVRPLRLLALLGRFFADVLVASVQVAWKAVRPRGVDRSSVVVAQLRTRDELFQTVVAEMASLVPGTIVVDLDSAAGRLALHVLGAHTPAQVEAARADALGLEERVLWAIAADPASTLGARAGASS